MSGLGVIVGILAVMALLSVVEALAPLHARTRWSRTHLAPNLTLTAITFATNLVMNAALVAALVWFEAMGWGLLNAFPVAPAWEVAIVVLALDLAFYVAHVSMHKIPAFWRVHRVHHSDPTVDVTTSIRQHPLEGLIRYGFIAFVALPLGVGLVAFAIYRLASAIAALFEHANIGAPLWLDRMLALVTTWPYLHKVHHSRTPAETDSNYGNILSIWDRLFGTFTPSARGADVAYGLHGADDPADQTSAALLAAPFRPAQTPSAQAVKVGG